MMAKIAFIYETTLRKQRQQVVFIYQQKCCLGVTKIIPQVAVFGAPCSVGYSAGYCLGNATAGDLPGSREGEVPAVAMSKAAAEAATFGCLPR